MAEPVWRVAVYWLHGNRVLDMRVKFPQWRSLKTRVTLLTLVSIAISIWSVAFYSSLMLRDDMQRMLGEQQFSAVTGMARDIDSRLTDRMHALETIAKELSPEILGNAVGSAPGRPGARRLP